MADDRVRVLWLVKGLGAGGTERLLVSHARFGDTTRFAYQAAYLRPDKDALVPELAAHGVPSTCLGETKAYDVRWAVGLRHLLAHEHIDIVHVQSPVAASVARLVARTVRPRVRVVYTEHNLWPSYSPLTRWGNRLTYALDDAHLAVSEEVRQSVPPRARRSLPALVHGIDLEAVGARLAERAVVRDELGVTDRFVVGIVANFREKKAYPDLLAAAAEVTATRPEVVFLSVGQGPLEAALQAEHERLGLGDRFRFLGLQADATRIMAAFDVFTLSSRFEGLPVTLMEARALGLPVVVTRVGGLATHVRDDVDGLLVEPGRPAELAAALCRVVDDPSLLRRLASASRAAATPFDAQVAVAEIERQYESIT